MLKRSLCWLWFWICRVRSSKSRHPYNIQVHHAQRNNNIPFPIITGRKPPSALTAVFTMNGAFGILVMYFSRRSLYLLSPSLYLFQHLSKAASSLSSTVLTNTEMTWLTGFVGNILLAIKNSRSGWASRNSRNGLRQRPACHMGLLRVNGRTWNCKKKNTHKRCLFQINTVVFLREKKKWRVKNERGRHVFQNLHQLYNARTRYLNHTEDWRLSLKLFLISKIVLATQFKCTWWWLAQCIFNVRDCRWWSKQRSSFNLRSRCIPHRLVLQSVLPHIDTRRAVSVPPRICCLRDYYKTKGATIA